MCIENGSFVLKIRGRKSSGRTPVRGAWTRRVASQVGRKRGGAGVSGVRQRRPREVDELLALLVPEVTRADAFERACDGVGCEPRPAADVGLPRRSERAQVTTDQSLAVLLRVGVVRPDPVLGEREQVGAPALPGPGRRHAHEVDVRRIPGILADELDEVVAVSGPVHQRLAYAS